MILLSLSTAYYSEMPSHQGGWRIRAGDAEEKNKVYRDLEGEVKKKLETN
jgi:hypothetical protein